MSGGLGLLALTAASVGCIHTLLGPDHYVPFIVLSKARGWSAAKTAAVTVLCGVGHVLSSVILGGVGIAVGAAVFKLEEAESARGEIAAWLLFSFGLAYLVWGIHRAFRNRPHVHPHVHGDTDSHAPLGPHRSQTLRARDAKRCETGGPSSIAVVKNAHVRASDPTAFTPWILFLVFVFGPCEPLIPILMAPAATSGSWVEVTIVALIFAVATIGTMLCLVMGGYLGMSWMPLKKLGRCSHALAGAAILLCGVAILFLDL